MIKVTFEFPTIDAAIVAMGKMVGAPVKSTSVEASQAAQAPSAPTARARKPRADAGKPRGPYKGEPPVQEPAAPAVEERTDKADTLAPVAAAPTPAPASPAEGDKPQPSGTPTPAAGVPAAEDAQTVFASLFDKKSIVVAKELLQRYGVGRVRELLPAQRQGFIAECNELLKEAA